MLLSSITQYGYEYTRKQLQLSKDQIYDKIKVLIKAFTFLSNLFGNTLHNIKKIKELMYIQTQPDEQAHPVLQRHSLKHTRSDT